MARRMESLDDWVRVPHPSGDGGEVAVAARDALLALSDEQALALWDVVYGAAVGNTDDEFLAAFRGALSVASTPQKESGEVWSRKPTAEQIEAVARAICPDTLDGENSLLKDMALGKARAAIEAMSFFSSEEDELDGSRA